MFCRGADGLYSPALRFMNSNGPSKTELWQRFQDRYTRYNNLRLAVDLSRVDLPANYFETMAEPMKRAFDAMEALEGGAIANPDEKRMVGHYWLRNASLAPTPEIREEIEETLDAVKAFARDIHLGTLAGAHGPFRNLLVIGIGGSALGPQFVANALGHPLTDRMRVFFFDNTDPDGMDRVLVTLGSDLGRTLCIVISKSGGTKETRNGMLEAQHAYERAGLHFGAHAVAVTQQGSELDRFAEKNDWIHRFPMWDWVGGRTSETSAVGLLPAALQGLDIDQLLAGARACDIATRERNPAHNPAAVMALMWHFLGNGKGQKDMVVLPYKDRLELFSKYLQQLIMESLGKEKDLQGKVVNQGLSVYGNKGSTDQHAYVQQLRDGLANFFVVFIEVLRDRHGGSLLVEPGVATGDFLSGFFLGTREALYESGRQSVTLTIDEVSAYTVGVLIALFERSVGLYATLVNINAYHQPGVEAGKKAAGKVIALQGKITAELAAHKGQARTAAQLAAAIGQPEEAEIVFKICEHLALNQGRGVRRVSGETPATAAYDAA